MSAKPDVVGEIGPVARVPQSVLDATVQRFEEYEREIESLKRQRAGLIASNAVLQEQKNEIELRLSTKMLSIHATYLDRIEALEKAQDKTGNFLQPLAGLREEFEQLRESVSGLLAREVI